MKITVERRYLTSGESIQFLKREFCLDELLGMQTTIDELLEMPEKLEGWHSGSPRRAFLYHKRDLENLKILLNQLIEKER